ncbi:MAG: transcriptional repressor [Anaerolineae bacterium]|nr:transcriptional repressor [Anaerolineae bacterium]
MNGSLEERLRQAGHRVTGARVAVLEAMQEAPPGQHFRPGQLLRLGRRRHRGLSRATVYRTLELLTSLGLLRPIYLGHADRCYIRSDEGHHHVICSGCGRVVGFEECVTKELEGRLARRLGFAIQGHLLEFYGLCGACQNPGSMLVSAHAPEAAATSQSSGEGCYAHR